MTQGPFNRRRRQRQDDTQMTDERPAHLLDTSGEEWAPAQNLPLLPTDHPDWDRWPPEVRDSYMRARHANNRLYAADSYSRDANARASVIYDPEQRAQADVEVAARDREMAEASKTNRAAWEEFGQMKRAWENSQEEE